MDYLRHRLDIFVLGVHSDRPEDHVEIGIDVEDLLADVENGDLAAAARGGPIHRKFRFARSCHCLLYGLTGAGRVPLKIALRAGQFNGPRARTSSTKTVISGQMNTFGGAGPDEFDPFRLNAHGR